MIAITSQIVCDHNHITTISTPTTTGAYAVFPEISETAYS